MENYNKPTHPLRNASPHPSHDVTNSLSDHESSGDLTQRDITLSSHSQNPKVILEKLNKKHQIFHYANSVTTLHKQGINTALQLPEIAHHKYFQCDHLKLTARLSEIQTGISNRLLATQNINVSPSDPSTPINRNHNSHATIYHTDAKLNCKDNHEWQFMCKCPRLPKSICCRKAMKWFDQSKKFKNSINFDYTDMKRMYQDIMHTPIEIAEDMDVQIQRDVGRTFPKLSYFSDNSIGIQTLSRILKTYTKYSSHVGYVQGMNFVCGSLLYHCSEEAAFWLFVIIMEDYELEEVYMNGLPGLYKHTAMVSKLLSAEKSLSDVNDRLSEFQISIDMFASDWVFTLFSNIIPIESMDEFYDRFFGESWPFFYKLIFAILKNCKKEIMNATDSSEILSPLRSKNEDNLNTSVIKKLKYLLWKETFWSSTLKDSCQYKLDNSRILQELYRYDPETKKFN